MVGVIHFIIADCDGQRIINNPERQRVALLWRLIPVLWAQRVGVSNKLDVGPNRNKIPECDHLCIKKRGAKVYEGPGPNLDVSAIQKGER